MEGAIGQLASLHKTGPLVAETETGVGGTTAWKLCSLDSRSTVAVFFETTANHTAPPAEQQVLHIQFATQFQHPSGQQRLRVVTAARRWVAPGAGEVRCGGVECFSQWSMVNGSWETHNCCAHHLHDHDHHHNYLHLLQIAMGFDQEAAAVVMARVAAYKCDKEEAFDVLRWIDRTLIRLASRFGEYQKDQPQSFCLPENFTLYPQFMFHMRRSQFLQVFGNSPDETAFYRMMLSREDVTNSVIMIQPMLMSYGLAGPPTPALLDVASIQPDRILLLDDFFHLVVLYGTTIAQWRDAGYHTQPEHAEFRCGVMCTTHHTKH